ncbi:MAG: hypothetical protein AAF573_20160 [Bacteroidota bacterium]
MKKQTIISILLLGLGFVFEYLYYASESTFFDVKFWLLGVICIIAGAIGIWMYALMPFLNERLGGKEE